MGRRWVAITGAGFLILGMIVASTATNMNNFIGTFPRSLTPQPDTWHDFWRESYLADT